MRAKKLLKLVNEQVFTSEFRLGDKVRHKKTGRLGVIRGIYKGNKFDVQYVGEPKSELVLGVEIMKLKRDEFYMRIPWKASQSISESKIDKGKTLLVCLECGHRFRRKLGPRTFEVRCPKCGSVDVEVERDY